MSQPTKQYPVTFQGHIIGHSSDNPNEIQFNDSQQAKDFISSYLNQKSAFYVSSRSLGKVGNNNQLYDVELQNYNIGLK